LLTGTTDTDEQSVTAGLVNNSGNSSDVLTSNSEEHQVHGSNLIVVLLKLLLKALFELFFILDVNIGGFVAFASRNEAGGNERLSQNSIGLEVAELLHGNAHELVVLFNILLKDKSVKIDTVALVSPKSHQGERIARVGGRLGVQ
jgi:hypothetical protein